MSSPQTFSQAENGITTDALFRSFVSALHNALAALGTIVQTADTGQINPATVTKPGAANTVAGFEIWKFNDSLQATYPCFIKIEYGMGSSSGGNTSVWITVGTSTDGAGTLGSIKTDRVQFASTSLQVGPFTWYISSSTSRLTMGMRVNGATAQACVVTVERLQTTSGADSTEGLVMAWALRNASSGQQVLTFSGTQAAAVTVLNVGMPTGSTTWANGADIYTGPIFPMGFGVFPALQGLLGYFNGDLTVAVPVSITAYGTPRSFYPIGTANINGLGINTSATLLMRND